MASNERLLRASGRVYRTLLFAYPEDFRREYGPHMGQVFGDLGRDKLDREGLAGAWGRTLPDLATSAFAERRSGPGQANGEERCCEIQAGMGLLCFWRRCSSWWRRF